MTRGGGGSGEQRTSHGPGSPSAAPTSAARGIESSFERPRCRHHPDPPTMRALDTPGKALSQHRRHDAVSEERSSKGLPPTGPNAPAEAGRSRASTALSNIGMRLPDLACHIDGQTKEKDHWELAN